MTLYIHQNTNIPIHHFINKSNKLHSFNSTFIKVQIYQFMNSLILIIHLVYTFNKHVLYTLNFRTKFISISTSFDFFFKKYVFS